ncbi:MAG: hypothetical protein P4L46_15765 [Fimbriimonas sp.]|nr:hypothetical protein [Fimbriimonas sp.]
MGIRRSHLLLTLTAFVLAAVWTVGCSSYTPDPDSKPTVKAGSIPPPTNLPPGMMKGKSKG